MLCLLKMFILVKHYLKQKWETFQGGDRELGWALSPAEGCLWIVASGHNFGCNLGNFCMAHILESVTMSWNCKSYIPSMVLKYLQNCSKSQHFSSSPFYFVRSYLGSKAMVESSRKTTKARKMDKNQHTYFGQNCAVMWYEITKSYVYMQ